MTVVCQTIRRHGAVTNGNIRRNAVNRLSTPIVESNFCYQSPKLRL